MTTTAPACPAGAETFEGRRGVRVARKRTEAEQSAETAPTPETFTDADGIQWIGWRVGSSFIGSEKVDKRGISESLKRRVRGEADAMEALKEAYLSPRVPDAETAAHFAKAPSERGSPFKWGTLEWYRNELALAQERILHLEHDRDRLLEEKRERDPILQKQIKAPGEGGDKGKLSKQKAAAPKKDKAVRRFNLLIATGDRDADEAMAQMIDEGWKRATLYRYLSDELERLGRVRKKACQQIITPNDAKENKALGNLKISRSSTR